MNKNIQFVAVLLAAASENRGFYMAQPVPDHEVHMACWDIAVDQCEALFSTDIAAWQSIPLDKLVSSLRTILLQRARARFNNDDYILSYYFATVMDMVGHVWRIVEEG